MNAEKKGRMRNFLRQLTTVISPQGLQFSDSSALLLLLFFGLCFFSSCKEEQDTTLPVITITEPADGLNLFLPDSVIVRGSVSDDNVISSVRISLVDQDFVPTSVMRTVSIGATSGQFNAQLLIDDVEIESGVHYIRVSADDGVNSNNEFVEVDVSEVPRVYQGMIVAVENGAGSDYVLLRPDGSQSTLHQSNDAHRLMDIDPISGQVYFVTSEQPAVQRIDVSQSSALSIFTPPNASSGEYFSDLLYDEKNKEVLISSASGQLIRINRNGIPLGILDENTIADFHQLASEGPHVLVETRSPNGDNKRLRTYDRISFAQLGTEVLPMDLFEILDIGGNRRLLIGQDGNLRKILIYDLSSSSFQERSIIGDTPPLDVCAQNHNAFLAYEDVFYLFSTDVQQLIPFSVPTTQAVAYDEEAGIAYLASGNTITSYGVVPWTMLNSWAMSGEVQDMEPLYNK